MRLGALLLSRVGARNKPAKGRSKPAVTTRSKKKAHGRTLQPKPAVRKLPATQPRKQPTSPTVRPELMTTDLTHPTDNLRHSIDGFLLDQRSKHTSENYAKDIKRFVKFLHSRVSEFGPERIDRMTFVAYKEFLGREGLEHTTIDRHLASLRSLCAWWVEEGRLERNPAQAVRFINPKRISKTRGLTDEEVVRLLTIPDLHTRTGSLHFAVLTLLLFCGLRRSELCAIRINQITMEKGYAVVRLRGKGNAERLVVVPPLAWKAVRHYFKISHRTFTGELPLLMPVKGGTLRPLDPSSVFYIVARYAKLAGVEAKISPHSLRATAISNARDQQAPDRAIQELAGWTSPQMITHYDKRRTLVERSASLAIQYGMFSRPELESQNDSLEVDQTHDGSQTSLDAPERV